MATNTELKLTNRHNVERQDMRVSEVMRKHKTIYTAIAMALAFLLLFGLVGCGDSKPAPDGSASSASSGAGTSGGVNDTAAKPEDGIKLTVNSGSDGVFFLPTGGGDAFTIYPYDWTINWGDGSTSTEAGEGRSLSSIEHTYSGKNTNYVITVQPTVRPASTKGDEPGWLQSFGFNLTNGQTAYSTENKQKILRVDGIIDDSAVNISLNGACLWMFAGCTNLSMGPNFTFSTTKTDAGALFASSMFENCSGKDFVVNSVFTFPQLSDTSLKDDVYSDAFAGVTAKQNRTALEIIGSTMNGYGSAATSKPLGTFSAAFDTTGVTNPNWYK
jgi:hypothetical protein